MQLDLSRKLSAMKQSGTQLNHYRPMMNHFRRDTPCKCHGSPDEFPPAPHRHPHAVSVLNRYLWCDMVHAERDKPLSRSLIVLMRLCLVGA